MGRLFWKIFLWFWFAMIITNLSIVYVMSKFALSDNSQAPAYIKNNLSHRLDPMIQKLSESLFHDNLTDVERQIERASLFSPATILVIKSNGQDFLGRQISKDTIQSKNLKIIREKTIISISKQKYHILVYLPFNALTQSLKGSPVFRILAQRNPQIFVVRLGLALFMSGIICFWLAWYLTSPVKKLHEASKQLANGNLDVRVANKMGRRRDEIADLGKDFDHMAVRLQGMIEAQKRLIQDVSHELRSPLARLQVVTELISKKVNSNADVEINRIKKDINRLENLVSNVLTVASLEENYAYPLNEYIDIKALLQLIVDDANFEAKFLSKNVVFASDIEPIIQANGELLRRAFENIVRNALKYTIKNSHVRINLITDSQDPNKIKIIVCDKGEGVAEDNLEKLFDPFYRTSQSRDRNTGGHGLGLAIAHRAINLHNGTITARNQNKGGLRIDIILPLDVYLLSN